VDSGDGLEASRVPRRCGCPQLWTVLWIKLSTVLHICVHRCGRMTSVCFPSFHRGRRTCGKLFEELGRLPPSYPQPVIHSPLSTVGCPQLLARRLAVGHAQRLRAVEGRRQSEQRKPTSRTGLVRPRGLRGGRLVMHCVSHAAIVSLVAPPPPMTRLHQSGGAPWPPEAFSHPGEGYGRVRGVWDDGLSGPSGR